MIRRAFGSRHVENSVEHPTRLYETRPFASVVIDVVSVVGTKIANVPDTVDVDVRLVRVRGRWTVVDVCTEPVAVAIILRIVRTRVAEATGYELRSEIRLIGFDEQDVVR